MNRKQNRKSGINLLVILLSAVFCLAVLGAAGYCIVTFGQSGAESRETELVPEGNVKIGTLNDPAARQSELTGIVDEGMLTFSINTTPCMQDGRSPANLMIENPPSNGNRFTVIIIRDDTGEEIYRSGYLDPEQYNDETELDVVLPQGEYSCSAYFDAYRVKDSSYIGRAAAQITLYVFQ